MSLIELLIPVYGMSLSIYICIYIQYIYVGGSCTKKSSHGIVLALRVGGVTHRKVRTQMSCTKMSSSEMSRRSGHLERGNRHASIGKNGDHEWPGRLGLARPAAVIIYSQNAQLTAVFKGFKSLATRSLPGHVAFTWVEKVHSTEAHLGLYINLNPLEHCRGKRRRLEQATCPVGQPKQCNFDMHLLAAAYITERLCTSWQSTQICDRTVQHRDWVYHTHNNIVKMRQSYTSKIYVQNTVCRS